MAGGSPRRTAEGCAEPVRAAAGAGSSRWTCAASGNDPAVVVSVAEYPTGLPDASVVAFSADAEMLAVAGHSTWVLLDLTAAVALATDPAPAACLAARTSPLTPDLASTVTDLQVHDPCVS
jgi:hypothetical protein